MIGEPAVVAQSQSVTDSTTTLSSWKDRIAAATINDYRALLNEALQIEDAALKHAIVCEIITAWLKGDVASFNKYFATLEVLNIEEQLRAVAAALKEVLVRLPQEIASSDAVLALVQRLVAYLATTTPDEALRWANDWLLDDAHDSALVSIARMLAKRNPEEGVKVITQISSQLRRMQASAAVAGVWAEQSPEEALSWASRIVLPTERALAMNSALLSVARQDPDLAAKRLKDATLVMSEEYKRTRSAELVSKGIREEDLVNDPEAYKDLLRSGGITPPESPDIELLSDAARVIAMKLAEKTPSTASEWASSLEGDFLKEKSMTGVLTGLAKSNPAAAVELFQRSYPDDSTMLKAIYDSWATVNPEAAANGIGAVADPNQRKLALETVVQTWSANGNPMQVAEFLDKVPAANKSDTVYLALVTALSATAPEEAWKRASAIENESMQYKARKAAFAVLASENPEVARELLTSTPLAAKTADRLAEMLKAVNAGG
ncbi:hypothetical protein ACXR0O_20840 [Verrucomicrobiota bacterium sgz303538]